MTRRIGLYFVCLIIMSACTTSPSASSPPSPDGTRMTVFESLTLKSSPNQYLVAPEGLCQNATPHETARIYVRDPSALKAALLAIINAEPRTTVLGSDDATLQYEVMQRSFLFRFPDYISIRILPVSEGHSTLAIYSRSKVGYGDLGVNKKRVTRWLKRLDELKN